MRHPRCAALLTLALAGCGEPTSVRIVDEVSAEGSYSTRDVELSTIDDLETMTGRAAELHGAPRSR